MQIFKKREACSICCYFPSCSLALALHSLSRFLCFGLLSGDLCSQRQTNSLLQQSIQPVSQRGFGISRTTIAHSAHLLREGEIGRTREMGAVSLLLRFLFFLLPLLYTSSADWESCYFLPHLLFCSGWPVSPGLCPRLGGVELSWQGHKHFGLDSIGPKKGTLTQCYPITISFVSLDWQ